MIHITFQDYKSQVVTLSALVEQLRLDIKNMEDEIAANRARVSDAKKQHEYDSDQIRELRLKISDLSACSEDLREALDKSLQENSNLGEKLKIYEQEDNVVVKADYYYQLKADAEKFREERAKHNANRRKNRAAKKESTQA